LNEILVRLNDFGLSDVILPFLLIFSLLFAILTTIHLFSPKRTDLTKPDPNKNMNVFLSLAIALMVVVPHVTGTYPEGADIVVMINNAIPSMSVFIVSVVMFLVILGVIGLKVTPTEWGSAVFVIIGAIATFLIFGNSANWFSLGIPSWLSFLNDPDVQGVILVVIMFWLVITLVTGPGKTNKNWKTESMEMFGKNFSKL
jgi:hypothetical protein